MIRFITDWTDGWDLGLFASRWTRLYFGRFMFYKEFVEVDGQDERTTGWKLAVFIDNDRAVAEFHEGTCK